MARLIPDSILIIAHAYLDLELHVDPAVIGIEEKSDDGV